MLWSFDPVKYCRRRAKAFGRHHAQVDLQAVAQAHRHLGRAAADDAVDVRKAAKWSITCSGRADDDQKIQIADRVASPAVAAGHFHLLDLRAITHPLPDLLGNVVGLGPHQADVDRFGQGHAGQNRFLGLRAKPFELANLLGLAGGRSWSSVEIFSSL